MASKFGVAFGEVARMLGNVNPTVVEKKHKDVVKALRGMEKPISRLTFPRGYTLKKADANGVKAEIFQKKEGGSDKLVLVFHGGAYISRMMFYYREKNKMYSVASGGGTVIHFDYTCAPEAYYPTQLNEALKVWDWVLSQGYKEENTVFVGDSAGGHLAISLMMKLKEQGRKLPKAAVLYSPWLDMTASGESYVYNYPVDPIFGIKGKTVQKEDVTAILSKSSLYMWCRDEDRTNPYISPVFAQFDSSYPPMFVTAGGAEMLLSDSQTLVNKLNAAGGKAYLLVGDRMYHAYPEYQLFPEAKIALKKACAFINRRLFE